MTNVVEILKKELESVKATAQEYAEKAEKIERVIEVLGGSNGDGEVVPGHGSNMRQFTAKQVRRWREQYRSGQMTRAQIQQKTKVAQTSISSMLAGRTYRWVK